ncbi:MAG: capsular polysaccharide synthesis protein [Deltaproteobacteria bacterium]|jgi:hypothetical protein|nr:capsular polysaccharide synthesis protein [Deltaproteobacteria bacterium]
MPNMEKRIFTFWEPAAGLPGYLSLCLRTWGKFLPDYEIVVLDYANLERWIGKDCYDESLYRDFSLPKQADAIRCAVLKRWGGVWFDTDTIVTSGKVRDLLRPDAEFTLLGRHIGFIVARKNAVILRIWENSIRRRIKFYAFYNRRFKWLGSRFPRFPLTRYMNRWDFLGNSILRLPLRLAGGNTFKSIDRLDVNALPELKGFTGGSLEKNYADFYFGDCPIEDALRNGGLIYLHNSWTPERYKAISAAEFLRQDITLARMLRRILEAEA